MKNILLLVFLFSVATVLSAQETAFDWTRTECGSSQEHHLFAELDSGYVVIIDMVMMSCAPCVTASHSLNTIAATFNESIPGKVRFYSVGFNNYTVCPQMLDWKQAGQFRHPVFEKGAEETAYYGGIGMPTIVILGGATAHKVYYNNFGYAPSDDPQIIAAIEAAIAESQVSASSDLAKETMIHVYPNPFTSEIKVTFSETTQASHLVITDISGREFLKQNIERTGIESGITLSTIGLPAGIWFVSLYDGERLSAVEKMVKE